MLPANWDLVIFALFTVVTVITLGALVTGSLVAHNEAEHYRTLYFEAKKESKELKDYLRKSGTLLNTYATYVKAAGLERAMAYWFRGETQSALEELVVKATASAKPWAKDKAETLEEIALDVPGATEVIVLPPPNEPIVEDRDALAKA